MRAALKAAAAAVVLVLALAGCRQIVMTHGYGPHYAVKVPHAMAAAIEQAPATAACLVILKAPDVTWRGRCGVISASAGTGVKIALAATRHRRGILKGTWTADRVIWKISRFTYGCMLAPLPFGVLGVTSAILTVLSFDHGPFATITAWSFRKASYKCAH